MRQKQRLGREDAEAVGLQALVFLTGEPSRMARFLDTTGMTPERLTAEAATPQMQAAILGYIAEDESLLLVFAATAGIRPDDVAPALVLLGADPAFDRSI